MTEKPADATNAAMLNVQKELLETYEQASRAWVARTKTEVELWSELCAKITGSRSVPEALQAYQKYATQRMQVAAEDTQRLLGEFQKITQKTGRSWSSGWPTTIS